MFSRRKEKQPLAVKLSEIYNDIANSSLLYLSLEENKKYSEALQGWKSLHTSLRYKLDALDKEIKTASLSSEEINLLDEIMILKVKCDDNLDRVQLRVDTLNYHSTNKSPSNTLVSGSTGRMNVPTLRSSNPQPMKYSQQKKKPMMKSLRSSNGAATPKNTNGAQSAQKAASLSWNSEDKVSNWAPSTSIGNQSKSYSTTTVSHPEDFEDFSTFDTRQLSRNETLQALESSGQSSRQNRGLESRSDDVLEEFAHLRIVKSPPQVPSSAHTKKPAFQGGNVSSSNVNNISSTTTNNSPYLYKQPQIPRFVINRPQKPRERQLVKESRPARQRPSQSPARQRPSQSPVKRAAPQQSSSSAAATSKPKPVLANPDSGDTSEESIEKDTEMLDDSTKMDEAKLIKSLKGVDPLAAKQILNEIVVHGDEVHWEDIAGLEGAKSSLKETVVYPFLRPDLFSGLREPARGMLLFGPPGTGKTMLARAVATESKSTFFSISASSLTSKYLGESEKLVRALFQLAKKLAPSIIFVDEIDSLLSSRNNEGENESSRRIKNEFLVQWSDLTKAAAGRDQGEDLQRVLVLAATNLPWAIDEAARRRFVRRQYIPLPEYETRKAQFAKLLSYQTHTLTESDFDKLIEMTDGYSGSDITALAKDAAMGPLRALGDRLLHTSKSEIRPIALIDFEASLKFIKPSVSRDNLKEFDEWAALFGSSGT